MLTAQFLLEAYCEALVWLVAILLVDALIVTCSWQRQRKVDMPLAVVMEAPERKDLKTCPGGFVMIRRMTYGEKLERRRFNSKMEMQMTRGSKDAKSIVDIFKEEAELYDIMHCVGEHNLTKLINRRTGQPCSQDDPEKEEVSLDLLKVSDIKLIAAQIAEEINSYIDELNNFELDDEVGNSNGASAPTS